MTRTELVAETLRELAGMLEAEVQSPRSRSKIARALRESAAVLDKVTAPGGVRLWWQNRRVPAATRGTR